MKFKILYILLFINSYAFAEISELNSSDSSIISNEAEYLLWHVKKLIPQSNTINFIPNYLKYSSHKTKVTKYNWFGDFWELFQPIWGTYSEGNTTNDGTPLTTFDRNIDITLIKPIIIQNIKSNQYNYQNIYSTIIDNATKSSTAACGDAGVCELAARAKDAAFIYLIGFGINPNTRDTFTLTETSNPTRESFKQKALDIMNLFYSKMGSYSGKSNQVWRAKENIMLIQAWDYLNLATFTGGTPIGSVDREQIRYQIFLCTYELYSRANNFTSGFEGGALSSAVCNNMNLIVAAAVGMGSILPATRHVSAAHVE